MLDQGCQCLYTSTNTQWPASWSLPAVQARNACAAAISVGIMKVQYAYAGVPSSSTWQWACTSRRLERYSLCKILARPTSAIFAVRSLASKMLADFCSTQMLSVLTTSLHGSESRQHVKAKMSAVALADHVTPVLQLGDRQQHHGYVKEVGAYLPPALIRASANLEMLALRQALTRSKWTTLRSCKNARPLATSSATLRASPVPGAGLPFGCNLPADFI